MLKTTLLSLNILTAVPAFSADDSIKLQSETTLTKIKQELLQLPQGTIEDLLLGRIKEATFFPVENVSNFLKTLHVSQDQKGLAFLASSNNLQRHTTTFQKVRISFIDSSYYPLESFKKSIFFYFDPTKSGVDAVEDGVIYPIITFAGSGDIRTYRLKVHDNKDKTSTTPTDSQIIEASQPSRMAGQPHQLPEEPKSDEMTAKKRSGSLSSSFFSKVVSSKKSPSSDSPPSSEKIKKKKDKKNETKRDSTSSSGSSKPLLFGNSSELQKTLKERKEKSEK